MLSAMVTSSVSDDDTESGARMCDAPTIQSIFSAVLSGSAEPDVLMIFMLGSGTDPSSLTSNASITEKPLIGELVAPELHVSNMLPIRSL